MSHREPAPQLQAVNRGVYFIISRTLILIGGINKEYRQSRSALLLIDLKRTKQCCQSHRVYTDDKIQKHKIYI